jgi:hypothetical protein
MANEGPSLTKATYDKNGIEVRCHRQNISKPS